MLSIAFTFSVSTCCFNLVTSSGNRFADSISLIFLSASALIVFTASVLTFDKLRSCSAASAFSLFFKTSVKEIARIALMVASFLVATSCVELALFTSAIPLDLTWFNCCFNLATSSGNKFALSISLIFLSASASIAFTASLVLIVDSRVQVPTLAVGFEA